MKNNVLDANYSTIYWERISKEHTFWGLQQDWKVISELEWICYPKVVI
jgi:hypothetical protein